MMLCRCKIAGRPQEKLQIMKVNFIISKYFVYYSLMSMTFEIKYFNDIVILLNDVDLHY